jgi:putative ATPase
MPNGDGRALAAVRGRGERLAQSADGDARRALIWLELAAELADAHGATLEAALPEAMNEGAGRRFDRGGDLFYDQISALHKAVRGSSPDAALYWFARMLDGGCDPLYLARRVARMASEDIGNADPRALRLALNAWEAQERMGSPEGELAIAQAIVYLAVAAKSNAVYAAFAAARRDVESHGTLEVPPHLRNAPTALARELGHGEGYRYAHDEAGRYAAGECYFPGNPEGCSLLPADRKRPGRADRRKAGAAAGTGSAQRPSPIPLNPLCFRRAVGAKPEFSDIERNV